MGRAIEHLTPCTARELTCGACPAHAFKTCREAAFTLGDARSKSAQVHQTAHSAAARMLFWRDEEPQDAVPVICDGWAALYVSLADGHRQILSFVLPGDLVSTALIFCPMPHYQLEAITPVRYRTFDRDALKTFLLGNGDLYRQLTALWVEEKKRADESLLNLGVPSAEEQIARLILRLVHRLRARGAAEGYPLRLPFPLRRHHIADATALSLAHVNNVLADLQRRGILTIADRVLSILDEATLLRLAPEPYAARQTA